MEKPATAPPTRSKARLILSLVYWLIIFAVAAFGYRLLAGIVLNAGNYS